MEYQKCICYSLYKLCISGNILIISFLLFSLLFQELISVSPFKAADLISIHFNDQIEDIIQNLQVKTFQKTVLISLFTEQKIKIIRAEGLQIMRMGIYLKKQNLDRELSDQLFESSDQLF